MLRQSTIDLFRELLSNANIPAMAPNLLELAQRLDLALRELDAAQQALESVGAAIATLHEAKGLAPE
jgi:hypothetical protein